MEKQLGTAELQFGGRCCLVQHQHLPFITRATESFILKERVVCGPMQRLPTYILSGWGTVLTSEAIRHVFSLGGAPFLLFTSSCEMCPSSSPTVQADSLQWSPATSGLWVCSPFCPREGTGAPSCSSLKVSPSKTSVGFAGRVTGI